MRITNILLGANQPQGLGAVGKAGHAVNASQMLLGSGGMGSTLEDERDRQVAERRKGISQDRTAVATLFNGVTTMRQTARGGQI